MFNRFVVLAMLAGGTVARADAYNGSIYLDLRDGNPCASSGMSADFQNLPPMNPGTLWNDFSFRVDKFRTRSEEEVASARGALDLVLAASGSLAPATRQAVEKWVTEINQSLERQPILSPPPSRADFYIQSTDPEFVGRARVLHRRLEATNIVEPVRARAKLIAEETIQAADEEVSDGDRETGFTLLRIGEELGDFALSVTPGISFGKDLYEAVTGRRLVNGEELGILGRGIAVAGVLTLGATEQVAGLSKALARISSKLGAAGIEKAMRIGEDIAGALGREGMQKLAARHYSEDAVKFVGKMLATAEGKVLSVNVYNEAARVYTKVERIVPRLPLRTMEGIETRAIDKIYRKDGIVIQNSVDDVFKVFEGNRIRNHRYSIGGEYGDGALYTTIGGVSDVGSIVLREAELKIGHALIVDRHFVQGGVLDLTTVENLERLGLKKGQLIGDDYILTQILGDISRNYNIDAILVHSAIFDGSNLVRFKW